jgi:hypothetical protein
MRLFRNEYHQRWSVNIGLIIRSIDQLPLVTDRPEELALALAILRLLKANMPDGVESSDIQRITSCEAYDIEALQIITEMTPGLLYRITVADRLVKLVPR